MIKKILIIGTGSIGKVHIMHLKQLLPHAQWWVWREQGQADTYSESIPATVVCSCSEALLVKPDIAVIATPSKYRLSYLIPLLAAGIPCYVEKPLVACRKDFDELSQWLSQKKEIPLIAVGCNLRQLPSLQKIYNVLQQGLLGRLARAQFTVGSWLPDWRPTQNYRASYSAKKSLGGGVIFDLIHELDLAQWLLGDCHSIAAISGHYSQLEIETDDIACALLYEKRSKAPVVIKLDYLSRPYNRRFEIVGGQGCIQCDLTAQLAQLTTSDGMISLAHEANDFNIRTSQKNAIENFIQAVLQKNSVTVNLTESMKVISLALTIEEQAKVQKNILG